MRLPERLRPPDDPLLRFGIASMALALLCAGLVAAYAILGGDPGAAGADPAVESASTSSTALTRTDPGVEPRKEETVPQPREEEPPPPVPLPGPEPRPEKEPAEEPQRAEEPPEPSLPVGASDWPAPSAEQIAATRQPRRYDLPPGASLGLTVPAIDLYDVPVLRSNSQRALDTGVIHARGTSMPWSRTPERNVYLAGHRLGWPGTGSHLVFYRLDELGKGDEILLEGRNNRYRYRVTGSFVVRPSDTWVMGRVVGEDMVTLQTCTPIPGFQKRLIVRAERV